MRSLSVVIVLVSASMGAAGAARAEDFTGFYAGVNAGYALGKDKEAGAPSQGVAPPDRIAAPSLPPSALNAARTMKPPAKATEALPLLR